MTIPMPDSITPANLPPGYPAYLGYVDGSWPDFLAETRRFPGAHILSVAVTASDDAEGLDIEFRDATPDQAPGWTARQLARGVWRPVLYASAGTMTAVITDMTAAGLARSRYRLLSAHYGIGEHICGPQVRGCGYPAADGTQWTDQFPGAGGSTIDMSALADDFFGATAPQPTVEVDVQLEVLRQGSSGQQVRNWQGLLVAHAYGYMIAPASGGGDVMEKAGVDGNFGPKTAEATKKFQSGRHLTADGVVGAQTWSAALG